MTRFYLEVKQASVRHGYSELEVPSQGTEYNFNSSSCVYEASSALRMFQSTIHLLLVFYNDEQYSWLRYIYILFGIVHVLCTSSRYVTYWLLRVYHRNSLIHHSHSCTRRASYVPIHSRCTCARTILSALRTGRVSVVRKQPRHVVRRR